MRKSIYYGKKGAGLEKIFTIIIVLLVVAAVLLFIFRNNINEYLKQIPELGQQEDREINITAGVGGVSRICPIIIGSIADDSTTRYKRSGIWLLDRETGYEKSAGLYWYTEFLFRTRNSIEFDEWINTVAGSVDSSKHIHINGEFFNEAALAEHTKGYTYQRLTVGNMKMLDGAYFGPNNKICRDEI